MDFIPILLDTYFAKSSSGGTNTGRLILTVVLPGVQSHHVAEADEFLHAAHGDHFPIVDGFVRASVTKILFARGKHILGLHDQEALD